MKLRQWINFAIILVSLTGVCMPTIAQDDAAQDREANKSHSTLKKLPNKVLEALQLTEAEAADTRLGKKINVFMIGLDHLAAYKSGDSTKKLLIDTKLIIYPIYSGGQLKTSLSIRKRGGGWKNAAIGGTEMLYLAPIREAHAQVNGINEKSYFMVRVPGLYLNFLGYYQKGDLYLIPTHEHPEVALDPGTAVPARDVYLKMKPLVSKYKKILQRPGN